MVLQNYTSDGYAATYVVPTYLQTNGVPIGITLTNGLPVNIVGGSITASNPSVGTNGVAAPLYSTQVGFINAGGNEVGVSASNPLPVAATVLFSDPAEGTVGSAYPTIAIQVGGRNGANLSVPNVTASGAWQVDGSGVTQPVSGTVSVSAPTVTAKYGQVKIATTGTAVQLSSGSYVLQNGLIVYGKTGNSALGTVGTSAVTDTVDGTGNGMLVPAGAGISVGAGVNINAIYVNGTIGDIFSYVGS